jgi:hypothetical protein
MSTYSLPVKNPVKIKYDRLFFFFATVFSAFFVFLSLSYLSYANSVATKGYALKNLQSERISLERERESWNLRLVRLQSADVFLGSVPLQALSQAQYVSVKREVALAQ